MQTFDELEKKLLDLHHDCYVSYSKLLLSLATGGFAIVAVFLDTAPLPQITGDYLHVIHLLFLVSVLSGVFVQHQVMMELIRALNHAKESNERAIESGDESPIKVHRKPTEIEMGFYRLQAGYFGLAFVVLTLSLLAGRTG